MLKRTLLTLLLLAAGFCSPFSISPPSAQAYQAASVDYRECVVYVTRTGERYHVDGCRYLRHSRIPVSKRRAEEAGYTPCRVCGGSNC